MARGSKYNDATREKALALLTANDNVAQVAQQLGIPKTTLNGWKKEAEKDAEFIRLRNLKKKSFVNDAWSGIDLANNILLRRLKRAAESEEKLDAIMEQFPELVNMNKTDLMEFQRTIRNLQLTDVGQIAKVINTLYDKAAAAEETNNGQEESTNSDLNVNIRVV